MRSATGYKTVSRNPDSPTVQVKSADNLRHLAAIIANALPFFPVCRIQRFSRNPNRSAAATWLRIRASKGEMILSGQRRDRGRFYWR